MLTHEAFEATVRSKVPKSDQLREYATAVSHTHV
jgi:hypothetical protein